MPRTLQEMLDHADELADQAERYEPGDGDVRDATPLRALSQTVLALAQLNGVLADQVALARRDGHSWAAIAAMLGTSGEAARQRYGAHTADGVLDYESLSKFASTMKLVMELRAAELAQVLDGGHVEQTRVAIGLSKDESSGPFRVRGQTSGVREKTADRGGEPGTVDLVHVASGQYQVQHIGANGEVVAIEKYGTLREVVNALDSVQLDVSADGPSGSDRT